MSLPTQHWSSNPHEQHKEQQHQATSAFNKQQLPQYNHQVSRRGCCAQNHESAISRGRHHHQPSILTTTTRSQPDNAFD
jgi:hypothetical protein